MSRFVQGADRQQPMLLPECLDDYVAEENPVRVVDVFVDELDLRRRNTGGRKRPLFPKTALPTGSRSRAPLGSGSQLRFARNDDSDLGGATLLPIPRLPTYRAPPTP